MSKLTQRLKSQFSDPDFRHEYAEDHVNASIVLQIKALRDARGWSQPQLAERAGTHQSVISRLEDEDYGGWTIETLKRLARAFDVALLVKFVSFDKMIEEVEALSPESLRQPAFADIRWAPAPLATAMYRPSKLPARRAYVDALAEPGNLPSAAQEGFTVATSPAFAPSRPASPPLWTLPPAFLPKRESGAAHVGQ